MNFWGFSPLYLRELERRFPAFLDENLPRNPLKCEYFVPSIVDAQLHAGTADVTMLHTDDAWHGVTYHDDLPDVVEALRARGVEVDYMVKDNEGHGFHNEENRFDFYRAMEKFFGKHLKGVRPEGDIVPESCRR